MTYTPRRARIIKVVAAFSFFVSLMINALANLLPINGLNTGEISDRYFNYFAPASITFSIWIFIYGSLAGYVFWRLYEFYHDQNSAKNKHLMQVDLLFIGANIINSLWILTWHFLALGWSLVFMILLLIILGSIYRSFKGDLALETMPFRLYFGWITVATVANVTTVIVGRYALFQWLWNGGEVSEQLWTMVMVGITTLLGNLVALKEKDGLYLGVVFWSLLGIYLKHTLDLPTFGILGVANASFFGMVITLLSGLWIFRKNIFNLFRKN